MSSFILKYIAVDKLLHFLVSYGVGLTLIILTKEKLLSLFVILIIGLGKEVLDSKQEKNFFSFEDMVANIAGIIAAGLIGLMI